MGNILGTQMAIFNPLTNGGETAPQRERNIFQTAVNKVTDFAKSADDVVGGKIVAVAHTIDELNIDPLEKAKQVTPELREKVAKVLTDLHAPLADKLTILALTQVKNFLKGSITTKELGEGAMESVSGFMRGFMKSDDSGSASRAVGGGQDPVPGAPGGFVGLLSEKLSDGLTVCTLPYSRSCRFTSLLLRRLFAHTRGATFVMSWGRLKKHSLTPCQVRFLDP